MKRIETKFSRWSLSYEGGKKIPASVPGDIHADLFKAGIIPDPYVGENQKESKWVSETDFTYSAIFLTTDEMKEAEVVNLVFKGIDTFSEIYLNGHLLGETENMFLAYSYNIKPYLNLVGPNKLEVRMLSTRKKMDQIDTKGYFACFNLARIFVRKAQCHFGWDWAPDLIGYGIWDEVYFEAGSQYEIEDVRVVADDKGNLILQSTLNYDVAAIYDNDNMTYVEGSAVKKDGDTLRYYVSEVPFGEVKLFDEKEVIGKQTFAAKKFEKPALWWPKELGRANLYNYRVELVRGGRVIDSKEGRFGFRSVELLQEPLDKDDLGFRFKINGVDLFVRGTNWVPCECFTGLANTKKYERLLTLAKDANVNVVRVWGGGVYEKDSFYDLCDEMGLLVWQDMMFACADIPDDHPEFVENVTKELEYQVKRLRNHPSIFYWTGGNEKTGTYGRCVTHGDYFTNVIERGIVMGLDPTRPYGVQSPSSWADIGNDIHSGESHHNSFERASWGDMHQYRSYVAEDKVPFVSECAVMGPNSLESFKKFMPEDKLWPINELWHERLMNNPYGAKTDFFADRQFNYAKDLYGEPKSIEDFTAKMGMVEKECLRVELEYARSNKGFCNGILNWMFDDIWPSATWAIVDYYGEPKQTYYQLKRSFAPHLVTFVYDGKDTNLVVVNDLPKLWKTKVIYGKKSLDGKVLEEKSVDVSLKNGVLRLPLDFLDDEESYLYAEYMDGQEKKSIIYSTSLWSGVRLESDYAVEAKAISSRKVEVTIRAKKLAKNVYVHLKDNYAYSFSDNYFDVEAGQSKTILVSSSRSIDPKAIEVTDYAKEIR